MRGDKRGRVACSCRTEPTDRGRRRAAAEHMSVSAWVRRAIKHEKRERPSTAVRKKLELLRSVSRYEFPTGDYAEIAADVSRSYLADIDSHRKPDDNRNA